MWVCRETLENRPEANTWPHSYNHPTSLPWFYQSSWKDLQHLQLQPVTSSMSGQSHYGQNFEEVSGLDVPGNDFTGPYGNLVKGHRIGPVVRKYQVLQFEIQTSSHRVQPEQDWWH